MPQKATMTKYEFLEVLGERKNWGRACNVIQEAAFKALSSSDWDAYLVKSNKDFKMYEGSDGVIFNGHYFDWKEFGYKKTEIILAFLDYFNDAQLYRISKCL